LLNARIIAVGSELLTPSKIDTNSLWLTEQLNTLGVEVVTKSIVGDDRARLADAVRAAVAQSGIVILSGGLGPTEDDVTRDAVAAALERHQSFRLDLFEGIADRFRRIQRAMAENNKRQAYLIDGAEALPNDQGTAPGQWIQFNGTVVMLLPGPPRELREMFELQCRTRLEKLLPPAAIRRRFYRVAGIGESDLDQIIAPVYTHYANPVTTILASPGDIQIHLCARCGTSEEAESLLTEVGPRIEALLGDRIYSTSGESLEAVVGGLLKTRSESVSVAESLTGGMLGERLTSVPGSSEYFRGGFLTYNDEMKSTLLGVAPELLKEHTAVSEPVAIAMAVGAREHLGSTWAVSTTGYAGPDGGTDEMPIGTVFIGIAGPDSARAERLFFSGERGRVRNVTATWALNLLRKTLLAK
jgi:nicotinamide-nucleotide amidase